MTYTPMVITARLQQSVALDARYGIAFDGLLTTMLRDVRTAGAGSDIDGGTSAETLIDWPLPLSVCEHAGSDLWHWHASGGWLLDHDGALMPAETAPDVHRLTQRLDEVRAPQITVTGVPGTAGGARGRYRTRLTPVVTRPAAAIRWHAIGDVAQVAELIADIPAVGARRGSGEGTVLQWTVNPVVLPETDWHVFSHARPDRALSRPVPVACAQACPDASWAEGIAGIRPPTFHPARARALAVPVPAPTR